MTLKTVESTLEAAAAPAFDMPVSRTSRPRAARIVYAAGDGNLLQTYRYWKQGKDDPTQLSMTYSGQFFDACRRMGCLGFVLSQDKATGIERDEQFYVRQRKPIRFRSGPAPLYHLEQMICAMRVIWFALWHRADVVVAASGVCHWFGLMGLRLFGIKVVPTLHCVLWPKYRRPGIVGRIVNWFDGVFFCRAAGTIMSTSLDVEEQVVEMVGASRAKERLTMVPFLPSYRLRDFPQELATATMKPLRILYAGRLVTEKGVFDLIQMAQILDQAGRTDIEFDVCGTGPAMDEMKRRLESAGLSLRVRLHGHCERPVMREMFERCHAVIVPTTTGFVEGFNQVVAEGMLSCRPVITSTVCPAIDYVGAAAVVVKPDDVPGYVGAIVKLADDVAFYRQTYEACKVARGQFLDEERGWGWALETAVKAVLPARQFAN